MQRTALIIGAETYGLTGVGNDVATMVELLARRGFHTTRCEGPEATRSGILAAYERLIRDADAGDVVVVYYSGHGGIALPPPGSAPTLPRLQFIVPTDYSGQDFRGITAAELSVMLVRLTNVTRNVVVILDTCHAAHMSRSRELMPKALRRPAYADIAEHIARMQRQGLDTSVRDVLGNLDAVRIVASGVDQSAYEYTNASGRRGGLLTDSIAMALAEVADRPVSWAELLPRIRDLIRAETLYQRPEAEGPAGRLPFETTEARTQPGPGRGRLGAPVTIEWWHVGGTHPLPMTNAVIHAGERVYVRISNDGMTTVHVSLLYFDVLSRICLVTSLDPSGAAVAPGERVVIGRDELDGRIDGFPLKWPPDFPSTSPRPASFAVVVASAPDPPVRVYRDLSPVGSAAPRHDVHRISFLLSPGT